MIHTDFVWFRMRVAGNQLLLTPAAAKLILIFPSFVYNIFEAKINLLFYEGIQSSVF